MEKIFHVLKLSGLLEVIAVGSRFFVDRYFRLMRLDRPVGTLLLLYPTLAALWLAAGGVPSGVLCIVFVVGTFLMRSAGCVINDVADRKVDPHVARTRNRPLATGEVRVGQALALFVALCLPAALLLALLNDAARLLAVAGFCVAVVYPFLKRWTNLPQVGLSVAFSWGILMAFAAVCGNVPAAGWVLFAASAAWVVAYDTLYAMTDRDDDLKIGIKSTAILLGRHDRVAVGVLQAGALAGFAAVGVQYSFGAWYAAGLASILGCFVYQQVLIRARDPTACFTAFRNNTWVGGVLLVAVILELSVWPAFTAA